MVRETYSGIERISCNNNYLTRRIRVTYVFVYLVVQLHKQMRLDAIKMVHR